MSSFHHFSMSKKMIIAFLGASTISIALEIFNTSSLSE